MDTYETDPNVEDTDGDGMIDGWEVLYELNPMSGLSDSLAGWWKLDDGTGTNALNSAQDEFHGALLSFGGTTNSGWVTNGMLGGALRFDGVDDWVRIAQTPNMLTGGSFTVSAQVWLDATCTSDWPEVVSDYDPTSWDGYCLGFDTNQSPYAMVGFSGWTEDTNSLTDQWVWVVLEYDGTYMRLYRNGELADGPVNAGFISATNECFAIGNGQDPGYNEHWQGVIDDVRIYQSAIGTSGLAALYDAFSDADGDELTNLNEYRAGTDPNNYDSDGDLLPDGWEVGWGLYPCVSNSPTSDQDGDGLSDLDEYRYCTDPNTSDTDGDGVSDGNEVQQSTPTNPNTPDTVYNPTNCSTFTLTVGDQSGSDSERWEFIFREVVSNRVVIRHMDGGFGKPLKDMYTLERGHYRGRLQWIATQSKIGPDYDWRALINDQTKEGTYTGLINTACFYVCDPDHLLTWNTQGNLENLTVGRTIDMYIPYSCNCGVDIEQEKTNVLHSSEGSVTLNVGTNSQVQGEYVWSSEPSGISGTGPSVAFYPSNLFHGEYTVKCSSSEDADCFDICYVNILKVEIDNTASRDTDDIQVQYFTNNAGTFTYTAIPLEIYYTLSPTNGWTPDEVELRIKNPAGSTVRTIALSNNVGQQQTTWDGKDTAGDYVAYGSNYVVEIAATIGSTTCTATNGLTVYEIRQGNCVYRPITLNEHAAILYEYQGGNDLTDIHDDDNYTVMEHPGTGGITGTSNYGNFNNWIGAFCPPGLSRTQRKAILEKAHALDNADIPYVSVWEVLSALIHDNAALSPGGADWGGHVVDILRIRCDGTVEVAYEDVGERLYGGNAWWDIMAAGAGTGSNLALHNDGGDSMNPGRQRDGINAAHDLTSNRADALHLP